MSARTACRQATAFDRRMAGRSVDSSDEGRSLHWTAGPSVVSLDSPATSQRYQDDPASYHWQMTPEGNEAYLSTLTLTVTPTPWREELGSCEG